MANVKPSAFGTVITPATDTTLIGETAAGTAGRFPVSALPGPAANSIDNTELADMAAGTYKMRVTASTGDPEDATAAQATAGLNTFTSALKGLAPLSGGGSTNFLRADGSWAVPSVAGSPAGLAKRLTVDFGAAGNGSTNDATAISTAIASTDTEIVFERGKTYAMTAAISPTLTVNKRIIWEEGAKVLCTATAGAVARLISITLNGFNLRWIGGNIDGNARCNKNLWINGATTGLMTAALPEVTIEDLLTQNCRWVTAGSAEASVGLVLYAGFGAIRLTRVYAKTMNRDAGLGNSNQGTQGIMITHDGTRYLQSLQALDCEAWDITSDDAGGANDVSCDGFLVFLPNGPAIPDTLESNIYIRGGKYINCKGRALKLFAPNPTVENILVHRRVGNPITGGGADVNFECISGICRGSTFIYDSTASSTALINYVATPLEAVSVMTVEGCRFFNNSGARMGNPISTAPDGAATTIKMTLNVRDCAFYGGPAAYGNIAYYGIAGGASAPFVNTRFSANFIGNVITGCSGIGGSGNRRLLASGDSPQTSATTGVMTTFIGNRNIDEANSVNLWGARDAATTYTTGFNRVSLNNAGFT